MIEDTGFRIFYLLHILTIVVAFAPAVIAVLPGGRDGALGLLDRAGRRGADRRALASRCTTPVAAVGRPP